MAKCVEKPNRLASTIKTQQYTGKYNLGKTIVMKTIIEPYRDWHG